MPKRKTKLSKGKGLIQLSDNDEELNEYEADIFKYLKTLK
ncbi:9844_t:CDS:2 [Entrophospora sp. SA101]|nr:9844_t:CDS:2 [Entrophospora sp. SA101]